MPSTAEKIEDRVRIIAQAHRAHQRDDNGPEKVAKLANLRGRIEGLLIARCEVTGQSAGSETVERKADEVLGVARRPGHVGLIR